MQLLRFEEIEPVRQRKTRIWTVLNSMSGLPIGEIKWYPHWRRYCFFPPVGGAYVYDAHCLTEIVGFLHRLMEARRV